MNTNSTITGILDSQESYVNIYQVNYPKMG